MTLDNPKLNMERQNMQYSQYLANQQKPANSSVFPSRRMDLTRPMIERVFKARQGCGGCGK